MESKIKNKQNNPSVQHNVKMKYEGERNIKQ